MDPLLLHGVTAATATIAYVGIAHWLYRRSRPLAPPVLGLLAIAVATAFLLPPGFTCHRLGPIGSDLATLIAALCLVGPPAMAGALLAAGNTSRATLGFGRFLVAIGTTLLALAGGALVAFWVYIWFFGPDCWP